MHHVNQSSTAIPLDDLRTPESLAAERPDLLTGALIRHQMRSRDKNGLAYACVPSGKRVLISKTRYEAWLAGRAGK